MSRGTKRLQAESAAELDALLPALLDRAFKGECCHSPRLQFRQYDVSQKEEAWQVSTRGVETRPIL